MQGRWLLFLRHAAKCSEPEGECQFDPKCTGAKQLQSHILTCSATDCSYPRCCTAILWQACTQLAKHHCTPAE